jgi:hypothetical protein
MEGLAPMSDWRYEPERMALREHCLSVLLKKYGSQIDETGTPLYSTASIYECAQDWVSQGNPSAAGIVKYYEAYYGST